MPIQGTEQRLWAGLEGLWLQGCARAAPEHCSSALPAAGTAHRAPGAKTCLSITHQGGAFLKAEKSLEAGLGIEW